MINLKEARLNLSMSVYEMMIIVINHGEQSDRELINAAHLVSRASHGLCDSATFCGAVNVPHFVFIT
jgi:hypothetical protein